MIDGIAHYQRLGWAVIPGCISENSLRCLDDQLGRIAASAPMHGLRDVLERCLQARTIAVSSPLLDIAARALGSPATLIRGILLAKIPTRNWRVPWHQDVLISVRGSLPPGADLHRHTHGSLHIRPSEPWLSRRVALRLHLDDCPAHAGALRVLDGTHRRGFISQHTLSHRLGRWRGRLIAAQRGDLLIMHPLLLHASSPAHRPGRRVLHLEYAADGLPPGTTWSLI